jgi:ethanolamine ammonia-lyase small subunit
MNELLRTRIENPWDSLKEYTQARIAIGRCGTSLPTRELLDFNLCHARAIDAVNIPMNVQDVSTKIQAVHPLNELVLPLHSAASSRPEYLRRPDLGRKLSPESVSSLASLPKKSQVDIALVVADGLSSHAIEKNIQPLFSELLPELCNGGYLLSPVTVVEQGRVAIADEIGAMFNARLTILFIGERPGLKTPDSLGIYLTFDPKPGTTDERRNCISNVRTEGLDYKTAVSRLMYLVQEAFKRQLSGVDLKDEQETSAKPATCS